MYIRNKKVQVKEMHFVKIEESNFALEKKKGGGWNKGKNLNKKGSYKKVFGKELWKEFHAQSELTKNGTKFNWINKL